MQHLEVLKSKFRFVKFLRSRFQFGMILSELFRAHGLFCASHPWEVIFCTITLTVCMISMGSTLTGTAGLCGWNGACSPSEFDKNTNVVIMTIIRCMAVLYIYHQLRNLCKLGSKHILGIAAVFTVYSSFVFSTSVINFLQRDLNDLNEAFPFFLLLIDISKASILAQFALVSSNQKEVREHIARGMAVLGPTITLDTLVKALVIGIGTLSGLKTLEGMCCFACLSVIVNYLVFMTFFPACLALILEMSRDRYENHPVWQLKSFTRVLQEEEQKPNPVVQRVKIIMSAGLLLVHAHSRWPLNIDQDSRLNNNMDQFSETIVDSAFVQEQSPLMVQFSRWLTVSLDQLIMLVLAIALSVKYIFFESKDDMSQIMMTSESDGKLMPVLETCTKHEPVSTTASLTMHPKSEDISNVVTESKFVQTEYAEKESVVDAPLEKQLPYILRSVAECEQVLKNEGASNLLDDEILLLIEANKLSVYQLEKFITNLERSIHIRRRFVARASSHSKAIENLPYKSYNYAKVMGVCCENVVGYMPIPVGIAGPLLVDGVKYFVPMATTEGCLIASANRGCRALALSGGVHSSAFYDGMTRGPVVRLPTAQRAGEIKQWLDKPENFNYVKASFDSTSHYARLQRLQLKVTGHYLYIRFEATTGDAMGMNMLSKGTEFALKCMQNIFPDMTIVSLSGNYCTDKKPAAINWIEGRGKGVVCEAIIPAKIVKEVLKTNVHSLIDVHISKNLVGSAVAGCIGGFNAQAANIVTAIYIATGQDPAQNVTSSNCITLMERSGPSGDDLCISCTMPSLEIGTIGGGTTLQPQSACLELLGVQGSCVQDPGRHATTLARIVCATVLAGELSLMSALSAGHLVRSHMQHNRQKKDPQEATTSTS